MPSITQDRTLDGSATTEVISLQLDMHVLKACSLASLDDTQLHNDAYGTLALAIGGTDQVNVVAYLQAGYLCFTSPVSWTGSLPVDADHYLLGLIQGTSGKTFRLSGSLWKLVPDEQGRFIADP